jgi:competence protein CoiA
MQYSLVNGTKILPFPKGRGICEVCGSNTLAKCGERVMWHWAHHSKVNCDPWWENETPWHRGWKEQFPEHYREVVFTCNDTGEKHRADIISENGIVLEIQNSPISLEELRSRESFYKNLVWIVNGEKFHQRFHIREALLPRPDSNKFDDIEFMPSPYSPSCSMFTRKSEEPKYIHSAREIEQLIIENYVGHHPFHWVRPHAAWLEAQCPVLFDFGEEFLWRLEDYKCQFKCVRAISKKKIVLDVINEKQANDIASRFYPAKDFRLKQEPS